MFRLPASHIELTEEDLTDAARRRERRLASWAAGSRTESDAERLSHLGVPGLRGERSSSDSLASDRAVPIRSRSFWRNYVGHAGPAAPPQATLEIVSPENPVGPSGPKLGEIITPRSKARENADQNSSPLRQAAGLGGFSDVTPTGLKGKGRASDTGEAVSADSSRAAHGFYDSRGYRNYTEEEPFANLTRRLSDHLSLDSATQSSPVTSSSPTSGSYLDAEEGPTADASTGRTAPARLARLPSGSARRSSLWMTQAASSSPERNTEGRERIRESEQPSQGQVVLPRTRAQSRPRQPDTHGSSGHGQPEHPPHVASRSSSVHSEPPSSPPVHRSRPYDIFSQHRPHHVPRTVSRNSSVHSDPPSSPPAHQSQIRDDPGQYQPEDAPRTESRSSSVYSESPSSPPAARAGGPSVTRHAADDAASNHSSVTLPVTRVSRILSEPSSPRDAPSPVDDLSSELDSALDGRDLRASSSGADDWARGSFFDEYRPRRQRSRRRSSVTLTDEETSEAGPSAPPPNTPRRNMRVYNDSLPPQSQPQTPNRRIRPHNPAHTAPADLLAGSARRYVSRSIHGARRLIRRGRGGFLDHDHEENSPQAHAQGLQQTAPGSQLTEDFGRSYDPNLPQHPDPTGHRFLRRGSPGRRDEDDEGGTGA